MYRYAPLSYVKNSLFEMGIQSPVDSKIRCSHPSASSIGDVTKLAQYLPPDKYKKLLKSYFKKIPKDVWKDFAGNNRRNQIIFKRYKNKKIGTNHLPGGQSSSGRSSVASNRSDNSVSNNSNGSGRRRRSLSPSRARSNSCSSNRSSSSIQRIVGWGRRGQGRSPRRGRKKLGRPPGPNSPRRLQLLRFLGKPGQYRNRIANLRDDQTAMFISPEDPRDKNRNLPGAICRGVRRVCRYRDPETKKYSRFIDDGSESDEYIMEVKYSK